MVSTDVEKALASVPPDFRLAVVLADLELGRKLLERPRPPAKRVTCRTEVCGVVWRRMASRVVRRFTWN